MSRLLLGLVTDSSTFGDMTNNDEILRELESIAQELEGDMDVLQYQGRTVTVKFKLHTYECKSHSCHIHANCSQITGNLGQKVHLKERGHPTSGYRLSPR